MLEVFFFFKHLIARVKPEQKNKKKKITLQLSEKQCAKKRKKNWVRYVKTVKDAWSQL